MDKVNIDLVNPSFLDLAQTQFSESLVNEPSFDLPPKKIINKQRRIEKRASTKLIEQKESINVKKEKEKEKSKQQKEKQKL